MPTFKSGPLSSHSTQHHRFHLLDALRGLLAVLVVFRHSPTFLTSTVQTKDIFLAVDFFFCLSGFVIAHAYKHRLRTKLRLRDFMVARLIRFYPTYLVGMLLAFIFALGPGHLFTHVNGRLIAEASLPTLLFLPVAPIAPSFVLFPLNMSAWTLFLELIANLGYGILIRGKRFANTALVLLCLTSLCILASSTRRLDSGSTWPGALIGFARMGLSFPLGVFLLQLWQRCRPQGLLRRTRGLPTAVAITLLLLAIILVPTPFSGQRAYQLAIMTLVIPALIFFGADISLGPIGQKVCNVLGDLSYPLYIVHLPLLSPLFGAHAAHLAQSSRLVQRFLAPAYIAVLATFAWALRVYFDAPAGRWMTERYKRHIGKAPAPRQVSAPEPAFAPQAEPQLVQT